MKNKRHALTLLGCMLCGACVPGKFASRVGGVVIDSKSSEVLAGAKLVSTIPHRDTRPGGPEVVKITDEAGRFSFGPECGIFKPLTPCGELRELTISKTGYETRTIVITHRDGMRRVSDTNWKTLSEAPQKSPLRIELKGKKNG